MRLGQTLLGVLQRKQLEKPFRGDARPALEQANKVKWTQTNMMGQNFDLRLLVLMRLHIAHRLFNSVVVADGHIYNVMVRHAEVY